MASSLENTGKDLGSSIMCYYFPKWPKIGTIL